MAVNPQIRELQIVVQEKDELLKILTERLEVAAEQLDRLRRQGGPLEPVAHSSAPTVFDDPEVTEDFRQMLTDWRDLQSRGWFGSLEDRLDGIQDLISHLQAGPVQARVEETRPASVAEILAKYSDEGRTVANDSAVGGVTGDNADDGQSETSPTRLELPEPPPPVDVDHADVAELREALRQREDYIARLSDYLLAFDAADQAETEQPDIGALTAEQREAMEAWESKVRKELRQTQIQLWIERAQLSREQMQIQQMQHQLETETRRLGQAKQKGLAGDSNDAAGGADSQKSKNWLGLFGGK